MPWRFDNARFFGNKGNPQTGDKVVVDLINDDDPENVQTRSLTYGFSEGDGRNANQFRNAVKGEVKAHLAHLNRASQGSDVSSEFAPGS